MTFSNEQLKRMIEEAMEHAAEEASEKVLRETLTAMGFDVSSPEKLIQVQVDMAYLRRQRRASEQVAGAVKKSAILIFLTALASTIWLGFTTAINPGGG